MAKPDRTMLNCSLIDSTVLLRMQLKSVIKCDTPKNRRLFARAPGFGPPRITLLFTGRFEGRNDSRVGFCASRLDHAGAFEKASAVGGARENMLWAWSRTSDSALSNLAALDLSSAWAARFTGRRSFAA
jgi:hypothetical protein